jgi:(1->4)-alpha-D-glucan 1-alpha-D-glucosylmutase
MLAIKLTGPGVPDVYQGNELWDLSLTDPDNRRLVDFEARRRLLEALAGASLEQVLARADEGAPKLWLTTRALALRAAHPAWFTAGAGYQPLGATGAHPDRVVAFARAGRLVTIAPRRCVAIARDGWADTQVQLPAAGRWRDALTGALVAPAGPTVALARLLARFPVAILAREDG